jgi:ankyrin repeat protein
VAKLLLDKGADVNAKDKDGCTALSLASSRGNPEIVKVLKAFCAKG